MQDLVYELPRMSLLRTRVNKREKLRLAYDNFIGDSSPLSILRRLTRAGAGRVGDTLR